MEGKTMLALALALLLSAIPASLLAEYREPVKSYYMAHATLRGGEVYPLSQLFGTVEMYYADELNLTVTNMREEPVSIWVACESLERYADIGSGEKATIPLGRFCSISSASYAYLKLEIYATKYARPLAFLAIISLALFVAGSALGLLAVAQITAEKGAAKAARP